MLARGLKLRAFCLVVVVLAGVLVVVTGSEPAAPAAAPVASAPNEAAAFAAARRQGTRVEVANLTTETKRVLAEPNGLLVAELSAVPTRVRRGDKWVPVDATLKPAEGGAVRPRATVGDLEFSAGGDAPLVEFARDGKRMSLSWPGRLPEPSLQDGAATYRDVLPGVDLVMRARVDGYEQHVVVRDKAAADNPALRDLAFTLKTEGLRVEADAEGRLRALDDAGKSVFVSPSASMWDARGPEVASARVGVAVDGSTLRLKPDVAMLKDPATRFPVVVDPDMKAWNQSMWAKVFSGYPTRSYVNGTGDGDAWAKSGKCYGSDCNNIKVARTYFQFDTSFLAGRAINGLAFDTTVVHGPQCSTALHQLYYADWGLGWDTNWNNMPSGHWVADAGVGGGDSCGTYQDVRFSPQPGNINPGGVSTYFLRAANESLTSDWRRYDVPSTLLRVWYNTRPNPPYEMRTDPPLPAPCRWCDGVPYVADNSIRLLTRLSDPDGNDQLHPIWDIYGGPSADHRDVGPNQASGAYFSTDVNLQDRDGQRVSWTVWGSDGLDGGDWRNGPGPFVVDQVGVDKPPAVSAALYREDNLWHGGVDVPDTFTFDSNGVTDVDHFLYGWNDPPTTPVDADALGGKASVKLTPPGDGPRDLYVQSVDRAGHRSPNRVYHFYVRAGNGPLAQWSFDGNTKDTATLGFRDATLHGNPAYTPGAIGSAIRLDGVADYVTAPVSASTATSFTFAGWVNLARKSSNWSVLSSQNGTTASMVTLGYPGSGIDKWAFTLRTADNPSAATTTVLSNAPAQTGTWTHLAGVYDAAAGQIRLYVNGDLAGTQPWTTPWEATGEFAVGRAVGGGYLSGAADEIRSYDRALSDAEVKSIVTRDNVASGYWNFDETGGTTARNATAGGEMAVLQPGASFTQAGAVNGAVGFDGTRGYAATSGPALRTDQSFTVGAWVKPSKLADMAAVTQDGTTVSGLHLKQANGSWIFGMNSSDAVGSALAEARSAAGTVQIGVWTHLTGVYDGAAKTITLYVNGVQAATAAAPATPWTANGPFVIGRGQYGAATGFWAGDIDEVRAYTRPLAANEIQGIVAQSNVTAATWKLDGNAQDASGNGKNGTANGLIDWAPGQTNNPDPSDLAASFNGSVGYLSSAPAVDTGKSFSVAAWVKLGSKTADWGAVASQTGTRTSVFTLGYSGSADDRWAFAMNGSDADWPSSTPRVRSAQPVQTGVWTHLAATYNAATGEMQLFVNGTLSATGTMSTSWNATGEFDIGRAMWADTWRNQLVGAVDDVKVYSRPLFTDEVRAMAGRDLALVHDWQLDESSGTNTADSIGARPGTLNNGAHLVPGRVGNAVKLDGATGGVSTSGVDLRTDDSFTVSAWVYLDRKSDVVSKFTAVSVDGNRASKFRLGHVADDMSAACFDGVGDENACGKWVFEMAESDSDNAAVTRAAVSAFPAEINTWTHLTGVYDKQSRKTWLYVDGERVGDGTLNTAWQAAGGAVFGRGKAAGQAAQFWPGSIDDVRLYAGALDRDHISSLYGSYPALDTSPATLPTADVAKWDFDENIGTARVQDMSGRGHDAALAGGYQWALGRSGGGPWLDGITGHAVASGPVVNTGQSFSISAWTVLSKSDDKNYTIFGQSGTAVSGFQVQYNGTLHKWAVVIPQSDQNDPAVTAVVSNVAVVTNEWTHLAMSYDAVQHVVKLYVNGALTTVQVGVTLAGITGPFTIGSGKWNGSDTGFFPGPIDDVRVFGRTLSDSEVRKVTADVIEAPAGDWHFDAGTGKDYLWRHNDAVFSGGVTSAPGISGKGLQLDGSTGNAQTPDVGVPMTASFSVSAWAKLSRTDKVATVLGQDGTRMSGFVLQYRPELNRWVFGTPAADQDSSPFTYAVSFQTPVLDRWTHLTGIYDESAGQLRLYVDGQLGGSRSNVAPWAATRGLTIGRDLLNGVGADFFPGSIDEVSTSYGVLTEASIAKNAAWPTVTAGQLGRYVNGVGEHYTGATSNPPAAGYHVDDTLGMLVSGDNARTTTLYSCQDGADAFTSTDNACEGKTVSGAIGKVFTQQPTNVPSIAIYRCTTGTERFDSRQADCGGATREVLLGYSIAYAALSMSDNNRAIDRMATTTGGLPGYTAVVFQGYLPLASQTGTRPLLSCANDFDKFLSTDVACDGKTVLGTIGQIWSAPPDGMASQALYRCVFPGVDTITANSQECYGGTVDTLLGYTLTALPVVTPAFPAPPG
ncbi:MULTISPECIES: LamG domain-containing protein [Amycolatopsis]|uniref:LamG domain-containing protein n=1 Tax=Amycolatopsis TaxID=1813 RepID=UPI001749AF11|nr:LamG domain-containing protein [Amycolatopsis bullii]